MYVLGIDAGGTKTQCMVADENGRILGEGFGGAGNHQCCGMERAAESLKAAIAGALAQAGLTLSDISYGVFGMAGADGPDDFEILIPGVGAIMGDIPHEIVHDGWIGFRSADVGTMGVVSICGTGAGHGGQNRQGERITLRNLDYIMGNLGGGGDLVEKALHYAFRSEEWTWDKSLLEERIPQIFQVKNMEEVCSVLKAEKMTREQRFQIPIAVFELAEAGDGVCQKLICDMGYEEGRYAAGIIRRLHMEEEKVPAVLIGSLFKAGNKLLIDSYMKAVKEAAPEAYPVIPDAAPVMGAVRLALDHLQEK